MSGDACRRFDGQRTVRRAATAPAGGRAADPVLRVESNPAGAEVVLDGRSTGEVTPAPVTFAGPGPYTLRLVEARVRQPGGQAHGRGSESDPRSATRCAAVEVPNVPVTITSAYPVEVLSGEVDARQCRHVALR